MPTLNSIQEEITNILQVAEELPEDQHLPALSYLDELAIQEQSKADAIGYAVRKRKAEVEFLKDEERRIRDRRQAMERRMVEFKNYLLSILNRHNLQKIKGLSSTIFVRNVNTVNIKDLGGIPGKFKKIITDVQVDKRGIAEDLKNGWHIPGAELEQKQSLTIR